MKTYQITSNQGADLGTYSALNPIGALDAMSGNACGKRHVAYCEMMGMSPDDWTTDRRSFRCGSIGLLVVEVES